MFRFILSAVWLGLCFVASPASAWVEDVVAETERAANEARCVGYTALNDMVYVLNAPADRSIMSAEEERTAMIDLTRALGTNGRFAVTHGRALQLEAGRLANTAEGRRQLSATLERLSDAAITVFFEPYAREASVVRAEVTLLVRRDDNRKTILACTPKVWVDVSVGSGVGPADPGRSLEERARAFVSEYFELWSQPGHLTYAQTANYFADRVDFYERSFDHGQIYDERSGIARRWPYRTYDLLENTVSVKCGNSICDFYAKYDWDYTGETGDRRADRHVIRLRLRIEGADFKIIFEDDHD